jgi:hypothetical protein
MKFFNKNPVSAVLFCLSLMFMLPLWIAGMVQPAQADTGVDTVGLLSSVLAVVPDWVQVLGLVVTAASSVAALTPTPKDDGVVRKLRVVVDWLALNFGFAKKSL